MFVRTSLTVLAISAAFAASEAVCALTGTYFCAFRRVTGLPCPGCGMTRAWASLLRGDLYSAWKFHPLFWSVPALAAGIAALIWSKNVKLRRAAERFLLTTGGLYIAVWIVRLIFFEIP